MTEFATRPLPAKPDVAAPDGSDVRILLALDGGSMAHFSLDPGEVSIAVRHKTVEETLLFFFFNQIVEANRHFFTQQLVEFDVLILTQHFHRIIERLADRLMANHAS